MLRHVVISFFLTVLVACQSPANMKKLQTENSDLKFELEQAQEQIQILQASEQGLMTQLNELNRVAEVLGTEKTSRVQESLGVRSQVRRFVQEQIDALREFLLNSNLLDYIGGELVARQYVEISPMVLVDLLYPIPDSGTLMGVTGYFSASTSLQLKILRPVKNRYVVVWQSQLLAVEQAGVNRLQLPVSVGVEKGDLIAYVFNEAPNLAFDRGTGDTRYFNRDLELGNLVSLSSLRGGGEKRTYSIGVYAILK